MARSLYVLVTPFTGRDLAMNTRFASPCDSTYSAFPPRHTIEGKPA